MINQKLYFSVHSSVFFTKGKTRGIIINGKTQKFDLVPNDLCDLLIKFNKSNLKTIFESLHVDNHAVAEEYLSFLKEKKYIFFFKDKPDNFLENDLTWNCNYQITNSIIDYNKNLVYTNIIDELDKLGCNALQIRIFQKIDFTALYDIMTKIESTKIRCLEIMMPSSPNMNEENCISFFSKYAKLFSLYIYNSSEKKIINADNSKLRNICFLTENVPNPLSCGIIHPNYFVLEQNSIREALNHNSCLNRKISIDIDGNIKNCPSMKESFGNIKNTTITETLNKKNFKKYWIISKDKIKGCRDCEFRHICTDCRAYIESPKDLYSKPLKCGYDPFTNKWEDWSTNPLKQKIIEHYDMQELVKKN